MPIPEVYKERTSNKRCGWCDQTAAPGRMYCEEHLDKKRQHARSERERRKALGICQICGKRPANPGSGRCEPCRIKQNADSIPRQRKYRKALKDEVYEKYGGYVCACCGETEPLFLTLDHVGNDGAAHRRRVAEDMGRDHLINGMNWNNSIVMYQWLKKNGFPDGYQILCQNCNSGKHRNGGVCPHEEKRR